MSDELSGCISDGNLYCINWSAQEMLALITLVCGEVSDQPACMHGLARAFVSRINKVCKLKKTPNNL